MADKNGRQPEAVALSAYCFLAGQLNMQHL